MGIRLALTTVTALSFSLGCDGRGGCPLDIGGTYEVTEEHVDANGCSDGTPSDAGGTFAIASCMFS